MFFLDPFKVEFVFRGLGTADASECMARRQRLEPDFDPAHGARLHSRLVMFADILEAAGVRVRRISVNEPLTL